MKEKNEISFIFCYARSGGTFLNRFLNNFDNLVILSEAHPIHNSKGGIHTIKEQMKRWYGFDISSIDYIDQIIEIKEWCDANNKYLIIRDWSYIDFAQSHLNNYQPALKSTNLELLEGIFTINKIAFVRDAIDVFLSTDHKLEKFAKEYLEFVKYIIKLGIPIFKYEDFCKNSEKSMEEISDYLKISVEINSNSKTINSKKVIGDINFSRGNNSCDIKILPRKFAFPFLIKQINTNRHLIEANKLLGYPIRYDSKECETFNEYLNFFIKKTISNISKVSKKIK